MAKFRCHIFHRSWDIRYENFENHVFLSLFSHVFTRRMNIAIFVRFSNRDFAHQMMSERETAIMFVVFSSLYKMVKEFLRYLYSCRNGAIPKISPETTKNDPTLEPPGGRNFRLGWLTYRSVHNFLHPSYNDVSTVHKFWIEPRQRFAPFGLHQKIRTSVRPEVEIGDQVPSTFWYQKWFHIYPENLGFLANPVPEILWKNKFLLRRAPPGDDVENRKSVLQFWRHPRDAQTRERTSRNSVGKCSVPALHARKRVKNKRDRCKTMH